MKRIIASFAVLAILASTANAGVYINEVLANPSGSDGGNEYIELRGTPGMLLDGYFLISVEGQANSNLGDINMFFDLSTFSLGTNGYLLGLQNDKAGPPVVPNPYLPYATPGATVMMNTNGTGWGFGTAGYFDLSSIDYETDAINGLGYASDLENGCTTFLLVTAPKEGDFRPTVLTDLDTNDDGHLNLPTGWTVVDSVGIMDGAGPSLSTDVAYGAVNFRAKSANGYVGTSDGTIVDVPGDMTTTSGAFYVGRKGNSTGSTAADWFGANTSGVASVPLNITFASASDFYYVGKKTSDMGYGGPATVFLHGDANMDWTVNVADLTLLLNNYNKTGMFWADGDFNADGSVNVADLTALLNNYNKTGGLSVVAGAAVPEPASLVMLAGLALTALLYGWRKRAA